MAKRENRDNTLNNGVTYAAEIICQGRHAGGFIGRNGNSIENLRAESGSTVKVSHFDQVEGSHGKKNDRLVQLTGNARQLYLGLKGVASRFAAISADNVQFSRKQRENEMPKGAPFQEEEEWNKFQLTLLVPSNCVGRIVGSKGRKIKELSEEYGCKVNLSRDFFPPRPSHRRTQLQHHEVEGLAHTAFKICEIVQKTDRGGPYPMYPTAPAPPPVSTNGYITTTHHPGQHPPPHAHGYGFPPPPPNTHASSVYPQSHAPEYPYNPYSGAHHPHPGQHAHPYTQPAPPPPPNSNNPSAHPPMSYSATQYHYMQNNPHFDKFAPY